MSSINFTCDVCGREVMGCTSVNGMKFCAKCYQETFGNKNNMTENLNNMYDAYSKILAEKDAKITDLEAKLAESKTAIIDLTNTCDKWADKYINLQKQLVEKEKEIEKQKKYKDQWFEEFKLAVEKQNSVAIQQLERVKEEMHSGLKFDYDLDIWATEFIHKIINEIKGEQYERI